MCDVSIVAVAHSETTLKVSNYSSHIRLSLDPEASFCRLIRDEEAAFLECDCFWTLVEGALGCLSDFLIVCYVRYSSFFFVDN